MPSYDFHQLSPHELELLARDLLQAHWKVTIESFKSGRDWGIDLRYAVGAKSTIVQVKHFLRTGFAGLLRELAKEAPKVRRLNPKRYCVVTSLPLSPANKNAIIAAMKVPSLTTANIFGAEDLNNLLGKHKEVEGRHYKLWIASRAVLDRVLHNAAITRSEFKVTQIYEKVKRYVLTNAYSRALSVLNKSQVVVLSGPPGVGKTTLADMLLYAHLERGYQAVTIEREAGEALQLYQRGSKQIFYFDDFMGATFRGDRNSGLDGVGVRAIVNLIDLIRSTPDARLVMTTRGHILSEALHRSERLRHSQIVDHRVLLELPEYTKLQRGQILYNHLYFGSLPNEYIQSLVDDDFFLKIVDNKKFNPRLIDWLSNFQRIRSTSAGQYRDFVQNLLDDPSEIWRHAYEQEITDASRSLLLTMYSFGGDAALDDLKEAFDKLHTLRSQRYGFQTKPEDFVIAERELLSSFIRPLAEKGYTFLDPSVMDLMNAVICQYPDNAADILNASVRSEQIIQIWKLAKIAKGWDIKKLMQDRSGELADKMCKLILRDRDDGLKYVSRAMHGLSLRVIFESVLDIVEGLDRDEFAKVLPIGFEAWQSDWPTGDLFIQETLEIADRLRSSKRVPSSEVSQMIDRVRQEVLSTATYKCDSYDLQHIVFELKNLPRDHPLVLAARGAFECYRGNYFQEELRDCYSTDHLVMLRDNLEDIRDGLDVDVDRLIVLIKDETPEVEAEEKARNESLEEGWGNVRGLQSDATQLQQMFGSLKSVM